MSRTQQTKQKIPVERLTKGLYVDLQLSWSEHPFLFSKFKIVSDQQIAAIRQLGLTEVTVLIDQCDVQFDYQSQEEEAPDLNAADALWKDKNEHLVQARQYRQRRAEVVQRYRNKAAMANKLVRDLKSYPANAIRDMDDIVVELVQDFEHQGDLFTNLVNLGGGAHSIYNHSVNVTILSLMLGAALDLRGDELRQLAIGALLHDVGKIELPSQIVNKTAPRTQAEEHIFQRHTLLGRKLTERVRTLPESILDVIANHHEHLDGSGYLRQLKGREISTFTRIVSIANLYDNLCNPPNPSQSMAPKTALAVIYTKFNAKVDHALVAQFIRRIGVYPPGTVVRLTDGSIGLVVTVDPADLLHPELLLYNPDIPKEEALIISLKDHPDLAIQEALAKQDYPSRIFQYLGIEERIGYFVETRPA